MPSSAWKKDVCSRSEEHTSELQSLTNLVCRLLLVKNTKILIQLEIDRIFGMKGPRYPDQIGCEVGEDAPVVLFVSIGQRIPRHLAVIFYKKRRPPHIPHFPFHVSLRN